MPQQFNFPYEIHKVDEVTNAKLLRDFKGK